MADSEITSSSPSTPVSSQTLAALRHRDLSLRYGAPCLSLCNCSLVLPYSPTIH
ncbi:hypothetical protein HanXRQr2_Chr14g0643201 [Helianthus annuus]|uniref:Uncharacterized protein n=1 Tax=Helianthus annuus TaxID=4232 RepID=A0A9K3E9F3_HELAN|nr:hypothetical protein HanXRQr2_Chr14g0643201 [Helianthus annuus]KAJ0840302.1 hypothetical protein HanPSC8_Chr14g0617071 [Helianthus annuus]